MTRYLHNRNYTLVVTTPATLRAVTPAQLREELRLDDDDVTETKLQALTDQATLYLEHAAGRCLLPTTLTEYYDALPTPNLYQPFALHRAPVSAVNSIKYIDSDGNEQTWAATEYTADTDAEPARISLAYGKSAPTLRLVINSFAIEYAAGYATADLVPAAAKEFIYAYCRTLWEARPPTPDESRHLGACINAMSYTL
jgi:uncharacterized phiE125 gp8 family phage protein